MGGMMWQNGEGGTGGSPRQKAPLLPSDKGRCPIKAAAEAQRPGEGAHGQPQPLRQRGLPAPRKKVR